MHGHGRTDESSLLMNASYLLRLIAPLAFNFLTLVRKTDVRGTETTTGGRAC